MSNGRSRFQKVFLQGDLSEGLPIWEWAPWWDLTIRSWREQGLPESVAPGDLADYFGLDMVSSLFVCPSLARLDGRVVSSDMEYERLLPFDSVQWPALTDSQFEEWNKIQNEGNTIFWMILNGPFGHTRNLFGIEPHLLAFYEHPRLLKRMVQDLIDFTLPFVERIGSQFQPDFMTFFEDMSYNHGPMIGRHLFDEFMAPFYRAVIPALHGYGIQVIIDSDGLVEPMIPWFEELGADGILPLERMAGNDVNRIRATHPGFKMIGGFDKTVMHLGEDAIRAEFQRIRPAVLAGRFVPGVDHQTPPEVSLDNYKMYIRLLREFSDDLQRESRVSQKVASGVEIPVRERFRRVMLKGDVSKGLPILEWASFWNLTLDKWSSQGLPAGLEGPELHQHLGLDVHYQFWMGAMTGETPKPAFHGAPILQCEEDYEAILPTLFAPARLDASAVMEANRRQAEGAALIWLTLEGFFWFPRRLFGIEPHLYAFYEQPDLMKRMNQDLLEFNIRTVEEVCRLCKPDFMTFAEDMSYNHGSMISYRLFEEFISPYYREILPILKKHDVIPLIDSDGDVTEIIRWFKRLGVQGILPLERMAGVDVNEIRKRHRGWKMIGGFDKTIMHLGEKALRQEFQRLKPAALSGRFIPSVDHQTPPAVRLEDYRLYVRLLKEFSQEVADEFRERRRVRAQLLREKKKASS